jgi:small GTP-binding protein
MSNCPKYKLVFVGDAKVGKTSLIHRYLRQGTAPVATLGATSTRVEVEVDGAPVLLNVWDTAGQETLRNLVPVYAKGAHAAVIAFDLSEPATCAHVPGWYDYIRQNVGEIVICVAANKTDKPPAVDINELFQWAADRGVEVTRTSAMEGENVGALFESVARQLERQARRQTAGEAPAAVAIEEPAPAAAPRRRRGCCRPPRSV